MELTFDADEFFITEGTVSTESFSLAVDDYEVSFRLPNSLDLAELVKCKDSATGRQLLLRRCISKIERQGKAVDIEETPLSVLDAVGARMGEIDLSGDMQLSLNCPQCADGSQAIFDIESFFWREISAWATRILREVHTLASAYGWREIDVLNMTAWRRQVYLNLIGA